LAGVCDFALFYAYQKDQVDPSNPFGKRILATTFDRNTSWLETSWLVQQDFHGVLRWVVSNGLRYAGDPPADIPVEFKAHPSALLIDKIEIVHPS